jgi:diguanylate cyclase (GGDEF)-like protein
MLHRFGQLFALLRVQIDHLETVNNKHGHSESGQLLGRVAARLDQAAREIDVVARYGSDGFVVIMPRADLEGASSLAERFRGSVERELGLTVSGGISVTLDGDTSDTLLERAEAALRHAQSAGGNRVFRHDGTQVEPILEGLPSPVAG